MKKFIQQRSIAVLTVLSLVFFSCNNDDEPAAVMEDEQSLNIVETAEATDALSSLVAALKKADEKDGTDLIGTLSGNGPFTVFAPTNNAFAALLAQLDGFDSLEDFDTDAKKDILATILTYHVVAGTAALSTDLNNGQMIKTVQEENITIKLDNGVFVDDPTEVDAKVVIADVEASNGIVHVIDKVLLPQAIIDALNGAMENDPGTLVDIVVATEPLSILKAAVIKAGLAETLASEGPFTVFAPTNDAFVDLLEVLGDQYNGLDDFDTEAELNLLKDILLYHVLPTKVLAADLAPGEVATALVDNKLEVIASNNTFVIGDASGVDANITATDIMASNGVAHTIDKVLLPQSAIDFVASLSLKNIVELAVATDDLSLLVDALIQADAGLVETLGGDGPFTVFAPTNEAFVDLFNVLGDDYNSLNDFDTEIEKELLTKLLLYHVLSGAKFKSDLSTVSSVNTLQGESLVVEIRNDGVIVLEDPASNDHTQVVIEDIEARNGVVHVINKVLIPQEVWDALVN